MLSGSLALKNGNYLGILTLAKLFNNNDGEGVQLAIRKYAAVERCMEGGWERGRKNGGTGYDREGLRV